MSNAERGNPAKLLYPPFAQPGDRLPAIEQFLDELPSIENYLDEQREDAEGWALSSWQSYDWSRLATLGAPSAERSEADADWSRTDWSPVASGRVGETMAKFAGSPSGHDAADTSADDVAAALDAIARRIRSGELSVDHFRGTPPEAAIAAAFAALIRMRG